MRVRPWIAEVGSGIGAVALGIALLAAPRDTPLIGRPPAWVGGAVGVLGIALVLVSTGTYLRKGMSASQFYLRWPLARRQQSARADELDWEALERERIKGYTVNQGLFLIHTWRPTDEAGQKVAVTARLVQHRDGPLTQDKIKSVEYVWGPKFQEHAQVVTRPDKAFAVTVPLYGPLLLIARVSFMDNRPPMLLSRYINFEDNTSVPDDQAADLPRAADPKGEIGALLRGSYFHDQPIKPSEFPGLIELLDLYRREPWRPDPALEIAEARTADRHKQWSMSLDPLSAYRIEADRTLETLQAVRDTLLKDLIQRMRHWDKWH